MDFRKERERMVDSLRREGLLHSSKVAEALKKVPREVFVSEALAPYAYSDVPLPTGHGQTISAPHGNNPPGEIWLRSLTKRLN